MSVSPGLPAVRDHVGHRPPQPPGAARAALRWGLLCPRDAGVGHRGGPLPQTPSFPAGIYSHDDLCARTTRHLNRKGGEGQSTYRPLQSSHCVLTYHARGPACNEDGKCSLSRSGPREHVHSGTRWPFLCKAKWALNRQAMFWWSLQSLAEQLLTEGSAPPPTNVTDTEGSTRVGLGPLSSRGQSPARRLDAFRSQSGADLVASDGCTAEVVLGLLRPPRNPHNQESFCPQVGDARAETRALCVLTTRR